VLSLRARASIAARPYPWPQKRVLSDAAAPPDLFVHTLRDIYYAEQKIVRSLPAMIEKAMDPQLKEGFERHLAETRNHLHARQARDTMPAKRCEWLQFYRIRRHIIGGGLL
jgi:hypothetical protein